MSFWDYAGAHPWLGFSFGTLWVFMVCDAAQNCIKVWKRRP